MSEETTPLEETPAVADATPEVAPEPVAVEPEPVVVEEPPAPAPEPEPVVVEAPAVEAPAPTPQEQPRVRHNARSHVTASGEDKDAVILANCVYKNPYARKSLTVHHVQRRLLELGFPEADADKDGWFGDLTKLATSKFQESKGLPATGIMDADTFTKLFEGDPHVDVVI